MQLQFARSIFAVLLPLSFWLAGCAPSPVRQAAPTAPEVPEKALARAMSLAAAGDHGTAAALYLGLSDQVLAPLREELQLNAAENYLLGQDYAAVQRLLADMDVRGLTADYSLRHRLLRAELHLAQGQAADALDLLQGAPGDSITVGLRWRYHDDRAQAFRMTGNLLESARELAELDLLLISSQERLENQRVIIQTLGTLTDTALELLQPDPPGIQGGWMELARILKAYAGAPERTRSSLMAWRERFPDHPALPELVDEYLQTLKDQYRRPQHLALLLPQSGPFAPAAAALRDGLLAAYYEQPKALRPQLRFYDSSNPEGIWPLYREAVGDGADMILGPLDKSAVMQLARVGELEVPVLALNQVPAETVPPINLYQFGLAPEDEAQQVAEKAYSDGHVRALVLTPIGEWGDRIYESFRARFEALNGSVLEQQRYDPKQPDQSAAIRALLNLDDSEARQRELQQILRQNVHFEPRRRQDVDFIFFAAKPEEARQIRPLLQFHYAAGLPVYATSHAYGGYDDEARDKDLEGLMFPDIPWLLAAEGAEPLSLEALLAVYPDVQHGYRRMYAMGIDSFNLLPHLARMSSSSWETMDGKTGNLYLDGLNQFHRRLVWAQMRGGKPRVIGYAQRIDSDPALQSPVPPISPLPFAR